ncbi:MAG: dephospho-CoA kinase [Marinoscillum sp.]|jgi:dephospho-CoA kinase
MAADKPMMVGLTGGIGVGKSIICKVFGALGIPTYDADGAAIQLVNADSSINQKIKALLGEEAFKDGYYNRAFVAQVVFSDNAKLTALNKIIHPAVADHFNNWVAHQDAKYVIKEAALLFESGSYKSLDKIICVTAPDQIRMKRVLKRDTHRTEDAVRQIMNKQWPEEKKTSLADFVINNDGMHLIMPQVLEMHAALPQQIVR